MQRYSRDNLGFYKSEHGEWVRYAEAEAEIDCLRDKVSLLIGAAEADEKRLRDAANAAEIGWYGCDTPEVMADTIGGLRAEVEKWKRVAVWAVRNGARMQLSNLQSGLDLVAVFDVRIPIDGTDEGLLAAIARAAKEE